MAMKSYLGPGFKASQCKTYLRLAISRINLLRNKRNVQITKLKKEIALLLHTGQETSACIQVENVIKEKNVIEAYDAIQQFAEIVALRLPNIDSQKDCPPDLKEGISSLVFAAPRCSDLTELPQASAQFQSKYGKDFIAAAVELRPGCGVNKMVIDKLSAKSPTSQAKFKLLKEIAAEHDVDWNTTSFEEEIAKVHEDLLEGPQQFPSAHDMPISEQSSWNTTQRQNLAHPSTQSTHPNPLSLPDTPVTRVHGTTPPSEISIEAPSHVTRRSSHDKNVLGNADFGSAPNHVTEVTQSQHGKPAENMKLEFDGAQATLILDQNYGKKPTGTSLATSGQIGVQAHFHDAENAEKGAMVETDRAVAAVDAAVSFASKGRSSQSADSGNDHSRLAHPQDKTRIGTNRDLNFLDDDSVYEHRGSEDPGERDPWPLKSEGPLKTNSSARASKSISKYNANDSLGSAEKDVDEEPHEGSGKHNTKLLSAPHKKGAPLEVFENDSQGFMNKKGKEERIAETFAYGQQVREPEFEEDTLQESISIKGKQRKNPDSVVNYQRGSMMHDEDNFAVQIQEYHDPSVDIEGYERKGDRRRKTHSSVDDTLNPHQEDESNRGLCWKGSDKANLNDDLQYKRDSNSSHKAIIGDTHAETFHGSIYSRNKATHPMEDHHKQSSIHSLGIGDDQGPQLDEPPKKGTTKSTKHQQNAHYDHDRARLWNDEPHEHATTRIRTESAHDKLGSKSKDSRNEHYGSLMVGTLEDEHQDFSRDRIRGGLTAGKSEPSPQVEGMRVSDDWYHRNNDDSLDSSQRNAKTKTKLSQTSYDMTHDHGTKSVGKEDSRNSAAGMRFKNKGDDFQDFESPKFGGYKENHVSSSGDAGSRKTKISTVDVEVKKGSQMSNSSPVFDELDKDILAPRQKGKGSIAKPVSDEFYKGINTRYIDDPGFNKGIRLRGADSEQLKTSRTSKEVDKAHNNEEMIPSSTSRSKQEWTNEKVVCHASQNLKDLSYPEESIPKKGVNLAGGLPHEQPKRQLRKAQDASSGYDELNSSGEIRTTRVVIEGGKEVRSSKAREDEPYVGIDKETTPRVYGDPQIAKHGEEFSGKKSESKKLPKSRLNDRSDMHGDDWVEDPWYTEGRNIHPVRQGDSSRPKKSKALESQGTQAERKKQPKPLDDASIERRSPNMASERDVSRLPKGKISNPSGDDDQNPPLQSNLGKLKVGKPMSSADRVSNYEELRTLGDRPSRAPKVEKSLKIATVSDHEIPMPPAAREVATASHHGIPLPSAAQEKSKLAGEPSYADSQTKKKSHVEPQQKSVAKDDAKASVKPVVPPKLPPILTGGASSHGLPKETSTGGASTPGIKLVKPPDYADFVAKFKRKS